MKHTKVINLFGAPCSSKSTTASGLFYKLKLAGCSVELVTEFAKELTYLERKKCLADQLYVTAQQNHRMYPLVGQVDFIITDSPILLGSMYLPKNYPKSFMNFVLDVFKTYKNINYFLHRAIPYVQEGRNQNKSESDKIGVELFRFLTKNEIHFIELSGCAKAADVIYENLKKEKRL